MQNNDLKTIKELLDNEYKFFIPDFQRGYRWTKDEVNDLLQDIVDFVPSEENDFYCLQPLVVQENKTQHGKYNVIDGQQRLTTIYLVLKYINNSDGKLFSITYENFENDDFWDKLNDLQTKDIKNLNQDYIKDAYESIKTFFSNKKKKDIVDIFYKKLTSQTKFIWYVISEDNKTPVNVFKRLNCGKIPLENAELVKALFLNRSNFENELFGTLYLRQLQIAKEWDEVERKLQDDKFWFFISNDTEKDNNRIEYILRLVSQIESDKPFFKYYYEKFNSNDDELKGELLKKEWEKIKKCYYKLEEWFNDCNLHNKIGYLLYTEDKNINDLFREVQQCSKSEFNAKIDKYIKDFPQKLTKNKKDGLNLLTKGEDDERIRQILLLHNVLTTNKKKEYFRFDLYKKAKWDIEHIASVGGDAIPTKKDDKINWVNATKEYLNKYNVIQYDVDIDTNNKENFDEERFNKCFNEINKLLNEINEDDINSIKNLVLLDSTTNRSYKNNIFPIKRREIIELDKREIYEDENENEIRYLLPCTRNVFLKYYSSDKSEPIKWTNEDAANYLKNLKSTLGVKDE